MGVINPGFFFLSIFIGAVIIFYMFRKQYEPLIIPSNLLWQQVMNEWQASPWLDKLQRNLLLFLQLCILTLLMFALIRPYWLVEGILGDHIIIIVDSSASMLAESNEGGTRFNQAKEEVHALLKQIDNSQEVTIIRAGTEPEILSIRETDLNLIEDIVSNLSISYEYSDMKKALMLAESLAHESTSLFVFSDGVKEDDIVEIYSDELPITVINIGDSTRNVTIRSFGTSMINGEMNGVALIENQSDEREVVALQIMGEDQVLFEHELTIAGNEQEFVHISNLPLKDYYKAQIFVEDDYSIDNEYLSFHQQTINKIYAVGEVSPFIIKGLENIGFDVLQVSKEDDFSDGIVVTENVPIENWPNRPLLAFTPDTTETVHLEERIEVSNDELFLYVDFQKTYVHKAYHSRFLDLPVIARSGGIPLIQKGTYQGNPTVVVHFTIEDSDWPLHLGFPIFLYHSVQWLSSQESFFGYFQPGERKWVQGEKISIYDENGEFIRSVSDGYFVAPNKPGLYQVTIDGNKKYFAVHLDEREKSISIESSFQLNQAIDQEQQMIKSTKPYDNLWFWLSLLALMVLFVEWEVTRRGA